MAKTKSTHNLQSHGYSWEVTQPTKVVPRRTPDIRHDMSSWSIHMQVLQQTWLTVSSISKARHDVRNVVQYLHLLKFGVFVYIWIRKEHKTYIESWKVRCYDKNYSNKWKIFFMDIRNENKLSRKEESKWEWERWKVRERYELTNE